MSDKQIVERNGVSMDRHNSGIDWNNDEAVVRASVPTVEMGRNRGGNPPWCYLFDSSTGLSMSPDCEGPSLAWKFARENYPTVVAFERAHRPASKINHSPWKNAAARENEVPPFSYENVKITASDNVPESEVNAAKKAVLEHYPHAVQQGNKEVYSNPIFHMGETAWLLGTEWVDAASRLPAPLTEDAPWDKEILDAGMLPDTDRELTEEEHAHNESLPLPAPASPVGEREGGFEAWFNALYPFLNLSANADYNGINDAAIDEAKFKKELARKSWDARSALASKPSTEGIPEIPKDRLEAIAADDLCEFSECITHDPIIGVCVACDAIYSARECLILRALLSAKDADIERALIELRDVQGQIPGLRGAWKFEYDRAEAAESELSALKLSIASVRDEAANG